MFIKTQLVKKVNELFFKSESDKSELLHLFPISKDISKIELTHIGKEFIRFNINRQDTNLTKMLSDLMLECSSSDLEFITDFARDLQSTVDKYQENLDNEFSPTTNEVITILKELSPNSVMVGGCIRDMCLGLPFNDIDFATDVDYNKTKEIFAKNGFKTKETGKDFLVLIVSKNNEDFEIARFRKDIGSSDGRHPDSVEIGTLTDDAERRDFGINALSMNLTTGKLQDPTGQGIEDLENRVIKFVGKPKDRLKEDALRGLRFYRFVKRFSMFGFVADKKSLKAVRENFEVMQKTISSSRVMLEIEKMCL